MKKIMLLLLCCTVCLTGCGDKSTTDDNSKETDKSVVESKNDSGTEEITDGVQVEPLRDVNEEYTTKNLSSINHLADDYFLVDVEQGSSFLVDSEGKFLLETYENCSINNGYLVTYEGLDKIAIYSMPDLKKIELEDDVIECLNVKNKFAVLKNDIFTTYSASWDLKTGKLLWKNLENAFPSPAYEMNPDYNLAEYKDSVYSLETGKILTDGYTDIRDTAILNNGLVVIWQNNDLVNVLDTTGNTIGEFTMTDDLYDSVCGMRFDDRLYFYDGGGAVSEFSSMMVDIDGSIIADDLHRYLYVNEDINDYYISSIDAYELDNCIYLGKDGILSDIPAKEGYDVLSEDIIKWERKDSGDTKFIIEDKESGKSLETFVYKANINKNNTNVLLFTFNCFVLYLLEH